MDTKAYLGRIDFSGSLSPALETLRALQLAHLRAVPFENLSIHAGQPIVLEEGALFDKIVVRGRGGFCYELNGLFAALLRAVGFEVASLSAGVWAGEGGFGPPFDHMTLLVSLHERWLVDVGFGDSFLEPLRLDAPGEQAQGERAYRIEAAGDQRVLWQRERDGDWQPQYRFDLQAYELADFDDRCRYHQTSPQSSFTRGRVCTRATSDGRVALSERRLIITRNGVRTERAVADEAAFQAALRTHFGISM